MTGWGVLAASLATVAVAGLATLWIVHAHAPSPSTGPPPVAEPRNTIANAAGDVPLASVPSSPASSNAAPRSNIPLASVGASQPIPVTAVPVIPAAAMPGATLPDQRASSRETIPSLASASVPNTNFNSTRINSPPPLASASVADTNFTPTPVNSPSQVYVPIAATDPAIAQRDAQIVQAMTVQPPKFVMSLCRDLQGNLWLGSEDEGVWKQDAQTGGWTQFTTKDGLGDDNGYAVACDRLGRIWAGHLNHGVSVYNGTKWQNYETVGGTSRENSLNGPFGERVFAIKVCPTDGDVWIATNYGLSRYREANNTWTYYSRSDGLPSDEVNALAFDRDGNLYLGTQCNGIATASTVEDYSHWRTIPGPNEPPTTSAGRGLPTNLINDVLVSHSGTIFASTDAGLAWSFNRGTDWQYLRGRDWADKVRGRYAGVPNGWTELADRSNPLAEDYCTALAEDVDSGTLWIGHRGQPIEAISITDPQFASPRPVGRASYVTCIQSPVSDEASPFFSTYGTGIFAPINDQFAHQNTMQQWAPMPALAEAPSLAKLNQILKTLADVRPQPADTGPAVIAIGDDWRSQGSWLGRYGSSWACLCAMGTNDQSGFDWVDDHCGGCVSYQPYLGANSTPMDGLRYWIHWRNASTIRALEVPSRFREAGLLSPAEPMSAPRRQSEWDDHGESYPYSFDGPNICCTMSIPQGAFTLSLYDVNKDGHTADNAFRDYRVVIASMIKGPHTREILTPTSFSRIQYFWGGAYKRFVVLGPIDLNIQIRRNNSKNSIIAGIFLDRLQQNNKSDLRYVWQDRNKWDDLFQPKANPRVAAAIACTVLDEMKAFNTRWYAIHSQAIWIQLLRWHIANRSYLENKDSLAQLIICCKSVGMWEEAEHFEDAQNTKSKRRGELELFASRPMSSQMNH
jgi:Two component regulator propeller